MKEFRLRFSDPQLQRCQWQLVETQQGAVLDSGEANSADLSKLAPSGVGVIAFVPQDQVLMTSAQLPPRASRQQLAAIAYAVEDQLADDVEQCFFAVGRQQADHSVPVAVIDLQFIGRVMQLLNQAHLNLRAVLPEFYLCPQPTGGNQVVVCQSGAGYLLRTGPHRGMYLPAQLLQPVIASLARESAQDLSVVLRGELPDEDSLGTLDGVAVVVEPARDLLAAALELDACINLKQKQFQSSHQWLALVKSWKWPAIAASLLLAVLLARLVIDYRADQSELDSLVMQQRQLLAQNLPELDAGSNPKRALARYLADQQGGAQQAGFVDLLHEYTLLQRQVEAVKTGRIQFQNGKLAINVETRDLKTMEDLRNRLAAAQMAASIENLSINPDSTTGRVVMGGDS